MPSSACAIASFAQPKMSPVFTHPVPMISSFSISATFVVVEPLSIPKVNPSCFSRARILFLDTTVVNASIRMKSSDAFVFSVNEYVTTGKSV